MPWRGTSAAGGKNGEDGQCMGEAGVVGAAGAGRMETVMVIHSSQTIIKYNK